MLLEGSSKKISAKLSKHALYPNALARSVLIHKDDGGFAVKAEIDETGDELVANLADHNSLTQRFSVNVDLQTRRRQAIS